jgi:hypothetical protein
MDRKVLVILVNHWRSSKSRITTAVIGILLSFSAASASLAAETGTLETQSLVIGSADSQWTSENDHSIILTKGSVVVIAGGSPLKVETRVGTVEVSPNLEAVVQQGEGLPITVTAIASRQALGSEENIDCALTVATNDDSTYKVYPGKQLKLTIGESAEVSDAVIVKQEPQLAMSVRQAASDMASAALSLLSDASANNSQVIDACANVLMTGSAALPARLFVTEGAQLVALQPGSHPGTLVASAANAKPKPKVSAPSQQTAQEEHQLSKLEVMSADKGQRAAWTSD